jgi:alkanesulfonate monooxygenase SsuD/methylene tetrahydromethanopterin reductase-like flavin-dependent oxidoreductase (luciferase family)
VKLAVQLPTYGAHATPENILLVARLADERGLDSVWVYDHVVTPVDLASPYPYSADGSYRVNPSDPFYEAITVLSHVAAATTRVRLGTAVLIAASVTRCCSPSRLPRSIGSRAAGSCLAQAPGGCARSSRR